MSYAHLQKRCMANRHLMPHPVRCTATRRVLVRALRRMDATSISSFNPNPTWGGSSYDIAKGVNMERFERWGGSSHGGILPYAVKNGKAFVMLGCEKQNGKIFWSDFGGSRDRADKNVAHTALREFMEESAHPAYQKRKIEKVRAKVLRRLMGEIPTVVYRDSVHTRIYRSFLVRVPATLMWKGNAAMSTQQPEKRCIRWAPWSQVSDMEHSTVCRSCRQICIRAVMLPLFGQINRFFNRRGWR